MSQIREPVLRVPLQVLFGFVFIFVCIVHTNRWKPNLSNDTSSIVDKLIGVALDRQQTAEEYALLLNAYSQRVQEHLKESIDNFLVNSEIARAQFLCNLSVFSSSDLGSDLWNKLMPQRFIFNQGGLKIDGVKGIVVWDKIANAIEVMKKMFGYSTDIVLESEEHLPTLETLHEARPSMDLVELAKIKSIIEACCQFIRSPYLNKVQPLQSDQQKAFIQSDEQKNEIHSDSSSSFIVNKVFPGSIEQMRVIHEKLNILDRRRCAQSNVIPCIYSEVVTEKVEDWVGENKIGPLAREIPGPVIDKISRSIEEEGTVPKLTEGISKELREKLWAAALVKIEGILK